MGETKIYIKAFSRILTVFIMVSVILAVSVSSNDSIVLAQPTLEDILAEIDAINARLEGIEANITALNSDRHSLNTVVGNIQSSLDSFSITIATSTEVAVVDSALNTLITLSLVCSLA